MAILSCICINSDIKTYFKPLKHFYLIFPDQNQYCIAYVEEGVPADDGREVWQGGAGRGRGLAVSTDLAIQFCKVLVPADRKHKVTHNYTQNPSPCRQETQGYTQLYTKSSSLQMGNTRWNTTLHIILVPTDGKRKVTHNSTHTLTPHSWRTQSCTNNQDCQQQPSMGESKKGRYRQGVSSSHALLFLLNGNHMHFLSQPFRNNSPMNKWTICDQYKRNCGLQQSHAVI